MTDEEYLKAEDESYVLTANKVRKLVHDCMYDKEELTKHPETDEYIFPEGGVLVEGIMLNIVFDPAKLAKNKEQIRTLLNELPESFHKEAGGGYSFFHGCLDKNGRQWGEHRSVESLLVLGIGVGLASFCAPREVWKMLPGGLPYFMVDTKQ